MAEENWHPADIGAALKKRGHSLSGLSIASGYHRSAAGKALKQSWPAMERIIAAAIGVGPEAIWPSRYSTGARPVVRHQEQLASWVGWEKDRFDEPHVGLHRQCTAADARIAGAVTYAVLLALLPWHDRPRLRLWPCLRYCLARMGKDSDLNLFLQRRSYLRIE